MLAVVGVNSTLYVMTLTRQVIRQANERAQVVTRHVFFQIQTALGDSAKEGKVPASDSAEDLRAYLQSSLEDSDSLKVLDHSGNGVFSADLRDFNYGRQWDGPGFERSFPAR